MLNVRLERLALQNDSRQFGVLLVEGVKPLVTLEPQWQNNHPGDTPEVASCIPTGTYLAEAVTNPKYGKTWILQDVPGRAGVYLHVGNLRKETKGCIMPGMFIANGGVCESLDAMQALRKFWPQTLRLEIVGPDVQRAEIKDRRPEKAAGDVEEKEASKQSLSPQEAAKIEPKDFSY